MQARAPFSKPRRVLFPLVLWTIGTLLSACSSDDGVWMLVLEPTNGFSCTESVVSHNYSGAEAPATDEDSEWTSQDLETTGSELLFAEFLEGPEDNAVLIIDEVAYPGTRDGDSWQFTWTDSETSRHSEAYLADYSYEETTAQTDTTSITITVVGDEASGTFERSDVTSTVWQESDLWSEEAGIGSGQSPVSSYLVLNDGEGNESALTNEREATDCSQAICSLQVENACSESRTFTASRTGIEVEKED